MKQMKDSGIEWIGQIPEDWEVLRVKDIAKIRTGGTESRADGADNYSTDFGMLWIKPNDLQEFKIIDKTSEYLNDKAQANIVAFPPYTFFVCCIGSIGKFGLTNKKAYCNQQINGIIIDDTESKKFCMYAIMSQVGQHWYFATGNVVKILNAYNQGRIYIAKPNKNEQQKIANFLDDKCAKIDRLIAYEQATIDELKAYKQSVITESVTKGLDKSVSMKDSGVEWIGKIPKRWEIKRAKYIATSIFKGNGITKEDIVVDGDTPCVRYGEIYSKYNISFRQCETRTNKSNLSVLQYFNYGDILFAGTGELVEEIGKNIVYLGETECLAGGDIIVLRHKQNPVFLNYALYATHSQMQKSCGKAKLKVVHISASEIGNIYVALPPIEEQKQIADYLDKKCADIDSLISIKQQKIEELKEYKKSLIYEYVTGKKVVI